MKRDMDLIRRILMEIEASPEANGDRDMTLNVEGHPEQEVMYHAKLLVEEGFIEAREATTTAGLKFYPRGLTWLGHEFLEKTRKDTLWEKAKRLAIEKTGGLSFEALKAAASLVIKEAMSAVVK